MPIRGRNLDQRVPSVKGSNQVHVGDVTATLARTVFVAPYACKVESIDLYSKQALAGASSVHYGIVARLADDSDTTLAARRSTSATAADSNSISANKRYRITPTQNNSLSTGQALELLFSATGSAVLSATVVVTTYSFLPHKESR